MNEENKKIIVDLSEKPKEGEQHPLKMFENMENRIDSNTIRDAFQKLEDVLKEDKYVGYLRLVTFDRAVERSVMVKKSGLLMTRSEEPATLKGAVLQKLVFGPLPDNTTTSISFDRIIKMSIVVEEDNLLIDIIGTDSTSVIDGHHENRLVFVHERRQLLQRHW